MPDGLADALQGAAVLAAALAAAGALALRAPRARTAALLAAPVLAAVALSALLGHTVFHEVTRQPALAAAGLVVGVVGLVVLVALIDRRPAALPILAVAAIPFRVPVPTGGGTTASLLVPLYAVIAAGCVAHLVRRLRGPAPAVRERYGIEV